MGECEKPKVVVKSCVLIHEVNCDKCHNFYYHVKVRVYAEDGHHFFRRNFVVWFDIFDVQDYYDCDTTGKGVTKKQLKEYAVMNAMNFIETHAPRHFERGLPSAKELESFTTECQETIDRYNGTAA